jgi:O-antigen/teichoic acid export membrane protein
MSRMSILKNTFALAIPNVLNPLVSFVLILVISRSLGVDGLGKYSLILSYFGIFSTVASLGLADLVVREAARRPQDTHRLFANAAVFGAVSSIAAMLGMNVVVVGLNYEREIVVASFVCSLALAASTGVLYAEAIFRAKERAEYVALCYVVENAIRVALCILLLWKGFGIVALFYAFTGTRLMGALLMYVLYLRFLGRPAWKQDRQVWKLLAGQAATFASIAIFSTVHLSVDQIMLSKLKSIEAVGIYSAADRLLTICKTMPAAFAAAMLPFLTKAHAQGAAQLQALVKKSVGYVMLTALPVVVGTAILADHFIELIYGAKFVYAGPVLRLHIVSLIPFSLVLLLAQTLIATDNQAADLKINIVAACMNVILNLVFIPPLGVIGSVLATLVTIVAFYFLQNVYVKSYLFAISIARLSVRPLLAALGMGIVTYGLRDWNLLFNVGISAMTYVSLAWACQAVSREDVRALAGMLLPNRGQ